MSDAPSLTIAQYKYRAHGYRLDGIREFTVRVTLLVQLFAGLKVAGLHEE